MASAEMGLTAEEIIAGAHGSKVCSPRDVVVVLVLLGTIAGVGYLIKTQEANLATAAGFMEDLGFVGHIVFFALYMAVGLPFGYNWSTLTALAGWAYGWAALVDVTIGTLCSALHCYYLAQFCFAKWLDRKISRMSEKKKAYLGATRSVLQGGTAGFLMQCIFRLGPLPFGVATSFLATMCKIHPVMYLCTTFLGMLPGMLTMINLGVVVRRMGSFSAATASPIGRTNLIVQVCCLVTSLVGVIVFARVLVIYALPRLIKQDVVRRSRRESTQKAKLEAAASEAALSDGSSMASPVASPSSRQLLTAAKVVPCSPPTPVTFGFNADTPKSKVVNMPCVPLSGRMDPKDIVELE